MITKIATLLRENRGSVAVEFALFLPLFLMMIFSITELGGAWYSKQMLVSASREGARLASAYSDTATTTADVTTLVTNTLNQAGYPGQFTVAVNGVGGSPGTLVSVTITSPYNFPVLGALLPESLSQVNMTATTVMRHE